jgi:peroxiredoxin
LPRSTLIIQFETRPSVPRGTITTVDYGPEVKGVQHVVMTSQDGKTFQGSMDGRTFTTSGIPRSLSAVRFADGKPPPTLKIGDLAPLLELRDLSGKIIGLRDVLGGRVLVLFWNPRCGFCQQMLNDLREWEAGPPPEAPMLVVVSTGTMEENRAMGLRSQVLIDDDFKAATAFGATGTPAGVLIDATGRIASKVTAGAQAVLALANALPLQMTEPSLSLVRATTSEVRATMSG